MADKMSDQEAVEILRSEEGFLRIVHGDDTANEHMGAVNHIAARLGGGEGVVAWADVPGFEGLYRISSEGDLFSTRAGKVLAKNLAGAGYVKADLQSEGKRVQTYIHKLVADAFLPPSDLPEINHINGIKTDNRASNLEWTTRSGNVNHNYYVLGYRVRPVIAHKISTGEERLYPSIESAVADGFTSAHIYRSLNNQSRTHKGFKFSYSDTTPPARLAATAVGVTGLPVIVLHDSWPGTASRLEKWAKQGTNKSTLLGQTMEEAAAFIRHFLEAALANQTKDSDHDNAR